MDPRGPVFVAIAALGFTLALVLLATMLTDAHDAPRMAHHAYEPFTVEVAVRDR